MISRRVRQTRRVACTAATRPMERAGKRYEPLERNLIESGAQDATSLVIDTQRLDEQPIDNVSIEPNLATASGSTGPGGKGRDHDRGKSKRDNHSEPSEGSTSTRDADNADLGDSDRGRRIGRHHQPALIGPRGGSDRESVRERPSGRSPRRSRHDEGGPRDPPSAATGVRERAEELCADLTEVRSRVEAVNDGRSER